MNCKARPEGGSWLHEIITKMCTLCASTPVSASGMPDKREGDQRTWAESRDWGWYRMESLACQALHLHFHALCHLSVQRAPL